MLTFMTTENTNIGVYTIGNAAKILGISVHTLRMYERESLIIPEKQPSHNRLYSENDINRIKIIRKAMKEKKFSIQAIKTMYSLIPCWAVLKCSDEDRRNCSAYNSCNTPCWAVQHENNICAMTDCRTCPVYNDFPACDRIKTVIAEATLKNV